MPIKALLDELVAKISGALGAVFVDPEGEAIELCVRAATPYEMRLEAAYHGVFLRRAARLASLAGAGGLRRLTIAGRKMRVLSRPLKGSYYLVLVLEPDASVAAAADTLQRASAGFEREIA
jgi:predicted regulator of Ras-like GTPase activity (Roadblock/LC7/MglB family)